MVEGDRITTGEHEDALQLLGSWYNHRRRALQKTVGGHEDVFKLFGFNLTILHLYKQ